MENIIEIKNLQEMKAKSPVSGVILIKDYTIQQTKNGAEYISGTIQNGTTFPFKVWGNTDAFNFLKENASQNTPRYVVGEIDDYKGSLSVVLERVHEIANPENYSLDTFLPTKYEAEKYINALKQKFTESTSEKCQELANKTLFNNEALMEHFKVEFAAKSFHDNCKSGLLAHTYKVVYNIALIIKIYPNICARSTEEETNDYKDLLFLGAMLHDIGKTEEMNFGVYGEKSIVNHSYLGVEMIAPYKERICELYGEYWYYELISIMLQHHNKFGEPAKTVAAYVINMADEYDARLTLINQTIEELPKENLGNHDVRIKIEDQYLNI